jgi:hypothetical protein
MKNVVFREVQQFRQWWVWLALALMYTIVIYGTWNHVAGLKSTGLNPFSDGSVLIVYAIVVFATAFLLGMKLVTTITSEGIHLRFFPFHSREKFYPKESIRTMQVQRYSPIIEFGGWGLRYGLFSGTWAYNVSGNMGLRVELEDGSKLVIGTREPEKLGAALRAAGYA